MKRRSCINCGSDGPFYTYMKRGKPYTTPDCRRCYNKRQWGLRRRKYALAKTWRKYSARYKAMRRNCIDVPRWVLTDSRREDKKNGRKNDLTKEFIEQVIANGCLYCGEKKLRMTLDRMDNKKGHTRKNVNPACIRCNYLRRNIPYIAWLRIAPAIRAARKEGLFGDWTGRVT
jgi:hypothetical protein